MALHQALYGELPFTGESVGALLAAIKERRINAPKSSRVPSWLRRLLRRGLSPDRADRFESMDRLLDELGRRRFVARGRILVTALMLLATAVPPALWGSRKRRARRAVVSISKRWAGYRAETYPRGPPPTGGWRSQRDSRAEK